MILRFPWPPRQLNPNFKRRNHWSKHYRETKQYRRDCAIMAMSQNVHMVNWPDGPIEMEYTFYAPKGCRWDRDNREAAFKAGQDGLADAMRVDDRHFRVTKRHGDTVDGGCVVVRIITPCTENVTLVGVVE